MDNLKINDRVIVIGRSIRGKVAFIGETHFSPEKMIGIVLDFPKGKHNGEIGGKRYFKCPNNRGLFVRCNQVEKETESSNLFDHPPVNRLSTRPVYPNYLKHSSKLSLEKSKYHLKNRDHISNIKLWTKKSPLNMEAKKVKSSNVAENSEIMMENNKSTTHDKLDKHLEDILGNISTESLDKQFENQPENDGSKTDFIQGVPEMTFSAPNITVASGLMDNLAINLDKSNDNLLNDLREKNCQVDSIRKDLKKLKTYLRWNKECDKGKSVKDQRLRNFLRHIIESIVKNMEETVNGDDVEKLHDFSSGDIGSSNETDILINYIQDLKKRNQSMTECLNQMRNIIMRSWTKSPISPKSNIERSHRINEMADGTSSTKKSSNESLESKIERLLQRRKKGKTGSKKSSGGSHKCRELEKVRSYLDSMSPSCKPYDCEYNKECSHDAFGKINQTLEFIEQSLTKSTAALDSIKHERDFAYPSKYITYEDNQDAENVDGNLKNSEPVQSSIQSYKTSEQKIHPRNSIIPFSTPIAYKLKVNRKSFEDHVVKRANADESSFESSEHISRKDLKDLINGFKENDHIKEPNSLYCPISTYVNKSSEAVDFEAVEQTRFKKKLDSSNNGSEVPSEIASIRNHTTSENNKKKEEKTPLIDEAKSNCQGNIAVTSLHTEERSHQTETEIIFSDDHDKTQTGDSEKTHSQSAEILDDDDDNPSVRSKFRFHPYARKIDSSSVTDAPTNTENHANPMSEAAKDLQELLSKIMSGVSETDDSTNESCDLLNAVGNKKSVDLIERNFFAFNVSSQEKSDDSLETCKTGFSENMDQKITLQGQ